MTLSIINEKRSITADAKLSFRLWLQGEYANRCKRNPRFSVRAFARQLRLDPSSLSQILSGKRPFSKNQMQSICAKIGASSIELKLFGLLENNLTELEFQQLSVDQFSTISSWYHFAILELTFIKGFQADPRWIAKALSVTVQEAKAALERLSRLELTRTEENRLVKTTKHLTNAAGMNTSAAHRELQRDIVSKALAAIDNCESEEKDITSITMAVDVDQIPKAREVIKRFRRELSELLESGNQTRVYNLAIQLYPISTRGE